MGVVGSAKADGRLGFANSMDGQDCKSNRRLKLPKQWIVGIAAATCGDVGSD